MRRASGMGHPDRWPLRWATVLAGGVLAAVFLMTVATTARAGGLFDWLFPRQGPPRSAAPPAPAGAPLATVRLAVEGMVCYGCVSNVKGALERLDGVVTAEVSLEEKAATVQYDPNRVTPDQMIAAINRIGFRASLREPPRGQHLQGQGTVVAIDLQKGTVTLDHGEIKGLMPPMVMEFVVDAREVLQEFKSGDMIRFTLRPRGVTFTIAEVTVVQQ